MINTTDDATAVANAMGTAGAIKGYYVENDGGIQDRFYMIDTNSSVVNTTSYTWGGYGTDTSLPNSSTDSQYAVGKGKENTQTLVNLYGSSSGTAWYRISELNAANSGAGTAGFNDWFIGTINEYNLFGYPSTSGVPYTYGFWSCVEFSSYNAWF